MNKKLQNKRVLADDHEHAKFPGVSFFIPTDFNSNNMKSTHNSSSSSKQATAAANAAGSQQMWRQRQMRQAATILTRGTGKSTKESDQV
jgi:hypothetical protein